MITPRLELDLAGIRHNATTLVDRLRSRGISVTGVTKVALGSAPIARELLRAGVTALGDARIENIERMRDAGIAAPIVLLRSPMLSQADRVVASADVSLNTELEVLRALSRAAVRRGLIHRVVLMVELGDLREGILPGDLDVAVRATLALPGLELLGIGTNLACQSGVVPDQRTMDELSELAGAVESTVGVALPVVTGGNSANLDWALGTPRVGRVNNLRLGESIYLGRETTRGEAIPGLRLDAVGLVGEIIESKTKPTAPWGEIRLTAFGAAELGVDRGATGRVIVALGRQDVDPMGLIPPAGFTALGASSDHLVLDAGARLPAVGEELRFGLNYSALLSAMTSPFVTRAFTHGSAPDGRHEVA